MKLYSLASSSSANSYIYEFANIKIVVDIGINNKHFLLRLQEAGIDPSHIDEMFITHEHTDHIKGLEVFLKNNELCVNISKGTLGKLKFKISTCNIISKYQTKQIDDLIVETIPMSHDADEPIGFIFTYKDEKYAHILDTGYIPINVRKKLKNCKFYLIESNYDEELLITNPKYPFSVKQRILSDKGHLSNIQCNEYLNEFIGKDTKMICFGHLSEQNNDPEIINLLNKNLPNSENISKIVLPKDIVKEITCN